MTVQYQDSRPSAPTVGTVIATQEIAGAQYQVVKLDIGASGESVPLTCDGVSRALVVMDYEHHEIHDGDYFRAGFQKDVGNGGTAIYAITTPNTTKWIHFRISVDVELEGRVQFYENPTSVTGGAAVTPRNANRNSAVASVATVVTDPTVNLTGAVGLGNQVLGSGKSSGGDADSGYEWILKQNEEYVIVVTNLTTSDNQVNIRCQWYEHTSL